MQRRKSDAIFDVADKLKTENAALAQQVEELKNEVQRLITEENEQRANAEHRLADMRVALQAAIPFLFEYGRHANDLCFKYPNNLGCHCGLDEAKAKAKRALATPGSTATATGQPPPNSAAPSFYRPSKRVRP